MVACQGQRDDTVSIRFAISKVAAPGIEIRDLRFYLHQVELLDDAGQARAVTLSPLSPWQSEQVALLDLSSANGNRMLQGRVAPVGQTAKRYTGIRFTLGVPFDLNHANPLTAAAPLNHTDLFWNWNSGYKFMRLDLVERRAEQHREWSFHLGSTGCSSVSALRPPALPCAQPNVVRVELRGFDPTQQPVLVQVNELVEALQATTAAACTGDYQHNPACADAYRRTGLNLASGDCSGGVCREQRLFGIE
jgi:uncharacterized repeat protein (TIGR04052 family)